MVLSTSKFSPYHPASNGQAQRAVRIFKQGIEKRKEGSRRTKLSRFLLKYRITPHTTTGVSPAELLMGRPSAHSVGFGTAKSWRLSEGQTNTAKGST